MKVLLWNDVEKLGRRGEIVEVKDGYARNYLIPRRLASKPTPSMYKEFELEKRRQNKVEAKLIAGATHIRARDFVVGTVIGELPGLIALSIFVDQITSTVKDPGPGSYALLAGSAVVIVGGVWLLRRWLSKQSQPEKRRESP